MHIDKKDQIAGVSIVVIKKILAKNREGLSADSLSAELLGGPASSLSANKILAEQILAELEGRGLIMHAETNSVRAPEGRFVLTDLGHRFALASTMKRLSREKAFVKLSALLERVGEVNSNPYYLYSVNTVVLFGSLATDQNEVSDIDLGFELVERQSREETMEISRQRAPNLSLLNSFAFGEEETLRAIKKRDPYISIHGLRRDSAAILSGPHRYLIGAPKSSPTK